MFRRREVKRVPESVSQECPSLETLVRRLEGAEGEEMKAATERHLEDCASCSTESALFREFLNGEVSPEEKVGVDWVERRIRPPYAQDLNDTSSWMDRLASTLRGSPLVWAGAAAMLLAAVLVVRDAPPGLPGGLGNGRIVERSGQLQAAGPIGDIDAPPSFLEVVAVADAVTYRFKLQEIDRTLIWEADSAQPRVELPAEIAAEALPGRTLVWRAAVLDESGSILAETQSTRFAVRAEGAR